MVLFLGVTNVNHVMTERIKQIMSHFNLTPASLADEIGVPRSSISHLLSGRNKPSLDFVLKLVKRFPEINLYWLLNGKGEFPAKAKSSGTVKKEPEENIAPLTPNTKTLHSMAEKQVSRIVFFYEDGTFETFQPKN